MSLIVDSFNQPVEKGDLIIPSFSSVQKPPYAWQAEIVLSNQEKQEKHRLLPVGEDELRKQLQETSGLEEQALAKGEIDSLRVQENCYLESVSIKAVEAHETHLSVTVAKNTLEFDGLRDTKILDVPALSQKPFEEKERDLRCSPTNLTMVAQYYQSSVSVPEVCDLVYHSDMEEQLGEQLLIYGIWPMAIYGASRLGLKGRIHAFSSVEELCDRLNQDIPVIVTVSYEAGELSNAAIPQTKGHLMTICGIKGNEVIVNDPGADPESVRRHYQADELLPLWLRKGAIGYVIEQ